MNLKQLDAFRATLRTGSITEAAKTLALSQASVTRLIKKLERSVGFTFLSEMTVASRLPSRNDDSGCG